MSNSGSSNLGTEWEDVAGKLGIPLRRVTEDMLSEITTEPLFLEHLELCKNDPEMLDLLLGEVEVEKAGQVVKNHELLARAGTALGRWIASGFANVSEEVYQQRLSTCRGCPQLTAPPQKILYRLAGVANSVSICGLCGCDVRRKARISAEACPDGRWEVNTA